MTRRARGRAIGRGAARWTCSRPGSSCSSRCCRRSSRSASGCSGAAGGPVCATRACRSSTMRCPGSSRIRRHLPFALFVLALASLVVAMARPVNIVSVPAGQTTVILAMDVSRSMCAHGHPAQPPAGRRGRGRVVHRAPGLDHPDRHRRLRRVRRDRPVADDRPGGPARRRREPDDRSPDGGRQRDPRIARRDRRDRRERRPEPDRRLAGRARPRRRSRMGRTPRRSSSC